jgi:hypothetical protein
LVVPLLTILYGAAITLVLIIYNMTVTLMHVRRGTARPVIRHTLRLSKGAA